MNQLSIDFEKARQEAELGMARSLERAECETPGWTEIALDFLIRYAESNEHFAGWMVVKAAALEKNFPKPPSEKAWGGVIKRAIGLGLIEQRGSTKDPYRHGNPIPLWQSKVFRGG